MSPHDYPKTTIKRASIVTMLVLVAAMSTPTGVGTPTDDLESPLPLTEPEIAQCQAFGFFCAEVSGEVTGTDPVLVHCEGEHKAATQATGRCFIEGWEVDSCTIGTLGGTCSTHGHRWLSAGQSCYQVKATTIASVSQVASAQDTECVS